MGTETDWPMFRCEPQRTGYFPGSGPTDKPEVAWSLDFSAPPAHVVSGDTVFVADPLNSALFAVESGSGDTEWEYEFDHSQGDSVLVDNATEGVVCVSDDGLIDQITFAGRHRSQQDSGVGVIRSDRHVLCREGVLYIGGLAGTKQIDLSSGKRRSLDAVPRSEGLAGDNGELFVLSGRNVGSVDASSGSLNWSVSVRERIFDSAGIGGTSEYIGVNDQNVFVGRDASLIVLDRSTGSERWRIPADSYFPPVLTEDHVYRRVDQGIAAVNTETQSEQWRFEGSESPLVAPVVADDVLFTGDYAATEADVYALDRQTGDLLWKRGGLEDLYELVVAEDQLIAGCGNGIVMME